MRTERATFTGGQGTQLGGRLDLPDDGARPRFAVFAHCFGCTKNLKTIGNLDRVLTDAGIGVLRFDFTGLGDSEGDFADTNFTSNVSDVAAAARFLEDNYEAPRPADRAFARRRRRHAGRQVRSRARRAVVTIAAPVDLGHLGRDHRQPGAGDRADGRGGGGADRPPLPHQEAVHR